MAGLANTYFCYSPGQALQASVNNAIPGAGLTALTVEWDSALHASGPGFRTTITNIAGVQWWDGVIIGGDAGEWPLLYAIGSSGASFLISKSFAFGAITPAVIAATVTAAFEACLAEMCSATFPFGGIVEGTMAGMSRPYITISTLFVQAGDMFGWWQFGVQNTAPTIAVPGGGTPSTWLGTSLLAGATSQILNTIAVPSGPSASQDPLPYDLDVAINNGANIFSVVSKTFTEPAGGGE